MSTDYYKTLGVQRGATDAEIKSAYRKLTKKYHPDVNDAPDAEDKIREINDAYDNIKDAAARAKSEQSGSADFASRAQRWAETMRRAQTGGFTHMGDDDLFRPRSGMHSNNISTPVNLPLDTMINGGTVRVPINVPSQMESNGMMTFGMRPEILKFNIEPNTPVGTRVILDPAQHGISGLNMVTVILYAANHTNKPFRIDGCDIIMPLTLDALDILYGNAINVELPTGSTVKVTIPEKVTTGQVIRLAGKGLSGVNGQQGDINIVTTISATRLDPDQITKIKDIINSPTS